MTRMTGAMIENGTRRIAANSGTQVSTTIRPAMLPRYMEAISPQTNSFCSMNSIGPGCRPQISRPPSNTAAVGEPGMPSASIGSRAAVPAACAAVSGAITPSSSPVPNLAPSLDIFLARPYDMNEAGVAPPGVMPIQMPTSALRIDVIQYLGNCFQVSNTTLALILALLPEKARPSS